MDVQIDDPVILIYDSVHGHTQRRTGHVTDVSDDDETVTITSADDTFTVVEDEVRKDGRRVGDLVELKS